LDGLDTQNAGKPGSNENGRFSNTWLRSAERIELSEAEADSIIDSADWYKLAKDSRSTIIMEPYFYSYTLDDKNLIFETSIIVPVIEKEQFKGVFGIDIPINELQKTVKEIRPFATGYAILLSHSGLIAEHPDTSKISLPFTEVFPELESKYHVLQKLTNHESFNFQFKNKTDNEDWLFTLKPIQFGNTGNYWNLVVLAPVKEIYSQAYTFLNLMLLVGIIVMLVLAIAVFIVSNSITKPILTYVGFAKQLSEGNLNATLNISRTDELGILTQALNEIASRMREIVLSISNSSAQIHGLSAYLNKASSKMTDGTAELATSTEEIASAMEKMNTNIKINSDNSKETELISFNAAQNINELKEAGNNALAAIVEINSKIEIINEIALKTNMLALNASVEAANAGNYGKGFSIIASEVRKLADRSRLAADDIISLSLHTQLLMELNEKKKKKLSPEVKTTAELIKNITLSNREQQNGIEQIDQSILQMNQVAINNSTIAEEIAQSANKLNQQAEILLKQIQSFSID